MSKRVRGTTRTHRRPGTRPPSDRSASARRPADFTAAAAPESQLELAEIVAEDIVEHQPAAAANELERAARTATTRTHHKIKANSLLAARAATEYVYVAQDMRRIIVAAAILIVLMFALWLLIVVWKVIPLPFY